MELARVLRKVIKINRDSDHIIIIDHYKHDFFLDIAIENPESRFFCRVFLGFSFFLDGEIHPIFEAFPAPSPVPWPGDFACTAIAATRG